MRRPLPGSGAAGNAKAAPTPADGCEPFLELTSDGVWRYDIVPSVSTKLAAAEQAELILGRARLGFCNRALAEMLGVGTAADLVGVPLSRLLPGTDDEKRSFVAASVGTGYRFANVEMAVQTPSGGVVWTLNNVAGIVRRGRLVGGWGTTHDISERRAAEAKLQAAHDRLRATLAAFPDLVFEIDAEGRFYEVHAPEEGQLYTAPEAFLGRRVGDVLPPDAVAVIEAAIREAGERGSHRGAKYSLEIGGQRRWFDLSIAAKAVERGEPVRFVAIVREITAQESAHAELRASEERLQLALDATSDGVYDVDFERGVTHYSPQYATMLGYDVGELDTNQATWERLLHPDDRDKTVDALNDCLTGKTDQYTAEFRMRTKAGDWRWILSRGRVVARGVGGRARRFVGTHRDVTGRVELREALRQQRDRAELYLRTAQVMLVALDPRGAVRLINPKGCTLLGKKEAADVIGTNWFDTWLPERVRAETESVFQRLMNGEIELEEYHENPIRTEAGDERLIAWHNALLRDREGRITGTLSSGEDITERREAEEALRRTLGLLTQSEEVAHVGSWSRDELAGELRWSAETFRIFGLEQGTAVASAETFERVVHPDDRAQVIGAFAAALRDGEGQYEAEFRIVRAGSGEIRTVHEKAIFARDEARRVVRSYGIIQDITDRRKADEAVRMNARVFEHSIDLLCVAGFDGYFKLLNPAWERTLGWSAEELQSRPWVEFIHPDDLEATRDAKAALVGGQQVFQFENRYICKDGSTKWLSWNSFPYPTENIMFGVARDVTEARRIHAALRDSEEKYRLLVENAAEAVFVAQDAVLRFANPTTARILGRQLQDIVGQPFAEWVHPDDREMVVARHLRRVRGDEAVAEAYVFRVLHADGTARWVEIRAVRIEWEGRPATLNFASDITQRRGAEAALIESERRFRELADALPTCVFEADLDGRLTYANRTGLDWFGYTEDAARGSRVVDLVSQEQLERAARTFRRAVEAGEVPPGEYTAVRKDGTTFPALVSSRAIVREGKAVGVRGILIDMTERVEAAQRIERALTGTIRALAVTTEMRDPYTAGHQERVTQLTVAIARKFNFADQRIEGLRVAGLLHDVGKTSVPAEILSKPSGLTAVEMSFIEQHPVTGHAILSQIDFPWPVAAMVLQHHERMDGSGYPHGLKGDEILPEARILAVADSVEAMASHRPYRAAVGIEEALQVIARGSGTAYDADVVKACFAVFEDGFEFGDVTASPAT